MSRPENGTELGQSWTISDSIAWLRARKAELDAEVAAVKAAGAEVTLDLALRWWNAATALRDLKEADRRRSPKMVQN